MESGRLVNSANMLAPCAIVTHNRISFITDLSEAGDGLGLCNGRGGFTDLCWCRISLRVESLTLKPVSGNWVTPTAVGRPSVKLTWESTVVANYK